MDKLNKISKSPSLDDFLSIRHADLSLISPLQSMMKKIKREDSEPSFRVIESTDNNFSIKDRQENHQDKNFAQMSSKISMLIQENQKLIEINQGLMQELDYWKNNQYHAQDNKIQNYQQKVIQLTQANEQLSLRLQNEINTNKGAMENKINSIITENEKLNNLLQQRLNETEILSQQNQDKQHQMNLLSQQIDALNEKCQVIEQQKQVLLQQFNNLNDQLLQHQNRENQMQQIIYDEQVKYQICIKNLEQNYQLQIQELQIGFQKEVNQQQQQLSQQYQSYYSQQMIQYQQQVQQFQKENKQIKEEIIERSKIWVQEKQRLESLLTNNQKNTHLNQNNESHYTFRQNTQEDIKDFDLDDPSVRISTQQPTMKDQFSYQYLRAPLNPRNYKIPQLNTLNKYDYQAKINANRDPQQQQRSLSQYLRRDDKVQVLNQETKYVRQY